MTSGGSELSSSFAAVATTLPDDPASSSSASLVSPLSNALSPLASPPATLSSPRPHPPGFISLSSPPPLPPPSSRGALEAVVELDETTSSSSTKTRLVSARGRHYRRGISYKPLVVSSIVTILLVVLSAYWLISVWLLPSTSASALSSSLTSPSSSLLLLVTVWMLAVNAALAARLWRQLERAEHEQFGEYIANVTSMSTHEPLLFEDNEEKKKKNKSVREALSHDQFDQFGWSSPPPPRRSSRTRIAVQV